LLTLLRRRHRVIIWAVVLLISISTFIGLQTTKTYTATALVMIQPRGDRWNEVAMRAACFFVLLLLLAQVATKAGGMG
jgi:uncharacterized protein involved in exopolysaccharide biosynthesis